MTDHECVFVEEQEPSGRLVLPPCIVCGVAAMDALESVKRDADGFEQALRTEEEEHRMTRHIMRKDI